MEKECQTQLIGKTSKNEILQLQSVDKGSVDKQITTIKSRDVDCAKSDENEVYIKNKKSIEIIATISGSLTKFSTGMLIGWSSPSIPKLLTPDSSIPLTSSEGSWIASSMQAGSIVSVFLMAATVDIIGRKRGILLSTLPILASWLFITQTTTFIGLFFARFISGVGSGYGKIVIGTYIGEIAEPSIRGALGTFMGITYILGVLFSYSIGPLVSIQMFAYIATLIPILLLATFVWMPETPYFYLMRGQETKARKQLEKLRGHTMIDDELNRIANGIRKRTKTSIAFKRLFCDRKNREPLFVISILFLAIQFTGKVPILSYCQTIFQDSGSNVSPYWATIITGLIQLIALIVSVFTVDRFGRRLLLIWSCFGCALSLGALAFYFFLKEQLKHSIEDISWLPLVALVVYNFVFNIGLGNIPFIMVGELFSTDVKSVAVCLTSICLPLSSVFNIKLYQIMVDNYGAYTAFTLFAFVSLLATIYCYFRVPETKGKTLEDIQEYFEKRR